MNSNTIAKSPSNENFERLRILIQDDIIGSIKANLKVGNITEDDASQLFELTQQLYDHIYQHYEELGGYEEMKPLLPGAMELPMDKYRIRIDELEKEITSAQQEKSSAEQKALALEQENKRLQELLKKYQQL